MGVHVVLHGDDVILGVTLYTEWSTEILFEQLRQKLIVLLVLDELFGLLAELLHIHQLALHHLLVGGGNLYHHQVALVDILVLYLLVGRNRSRQTASQSLAHIHNGGHLEENQQQERDVRHGAGFNLLDFLCHDKCELLFQSFGMDISPKHFPEGSNDEDVASVDH